MAEDRFKEAELLYNSKFYGGAYYLSGYAVEFGLKAVICRRLDIEMFDSKSADPVPGDIAKMFQIHKLSHLIILAGLHKQLKNDQQSDVNLKKAWSKVSGWTEQRRYDFGCNPKTAKGFLEAVKIFITWIQQHW